jgi:hypothetical protein
MAPFHQLVYSRVKPNDPEVDNEAEEERASYNIQTNNERSKRSTPNAARKWDVSHVFKGF